MLAIAILAETGNTIGTRIALTLLSNETTAGHCHEDNHRFFILNIQELDTFRDAAASISTENGKKIETCIALATPFSEKAAWHCHEDEHSHVACGSQALEISMCARDANESKLR